LYTTILSEYISTEGLARGFAATAARAALCAATAAAATFLRGPSNRALAVVRRRRLAAIIWPKKVPLREQKIFFIQLRLQSNFFLAWILTSSREVSSIFVSALSIFFKSSGQRTRRRSMGGRSGRCWESEQERAKANQRSVFIVGARKIVHGKSCVTKARAVAEKFADC
jgi:hypothetical protein